MAVTLTVEARLLRSYSGLEREGRYLPKGLWGIQRGSLGDASGGNNQVLVLFGGVEANERALYSIEELWALYEAAVNNFVEVTVNVAEPITTAAATGSLRTHAWLEKQNVLATNTSLVHGKRGGGKGGLANVALGDVVGGSPLSLPNFIWKPQRGLQWSVIVEGPNINAVSLIVTLWGYLWDRNPQDRGLIPTRPEDW